MKNLIIHENDGNNSTIDFEPVFKILNDELFKTNETLELVCAGGYVMQLHEQYFNVSGPYLHNRRGSRYYRQSDRFGHQRK